jgi:hypothetical protein
MAVGMTSILASSPAAPGLGTLPLEGLALAAGAGPVDAGAGSGAVEDVLDIRVPPPAASATAEAGDAISIRELVRMEGSDAAVALYRVALRGGGLLMLRGEDVTARTDFTPQEFIELQFVAGAADSRQDLVVVARISRPDGSGIVDSTPAQVAVEVTGRRSLNAAAALRTAPDPEDAAVLRLAREAAVYRGFTGQARPALASVGDITARAGDSFSLRELLQPTSGAEPALYRVALRGGGTLMLRGEDVTARTDFTHQEFRELQFVAGEAGSLQELVIIARTGRPDGQGGLQGMVDSLPLRILAAVTGTRSLNAALALRTAPGPDEAAVLKLAREAGGYDGFTGQARPVLDLLA